MRTCLAVCSLSLCLGADPAAAPVLPYRVVEGWARLPNGWNFGECSGVAVDARDHVWVFNRGSHPVIEFAPDGSMVQAWPEVKIVSAHGIRLDPQGNVWAVDVKGHMVFQYDRSGRVMMVLGARPGTPGGNDSKDAFNEPTAVAFAPNGDFFVTDGYVNSRVVKYNRAGEYLMHWGRKGTGDGEFNLVHDAVLDSRGRVYVADRSNQRIQVFDQQGRFLAKWTGIGAPWGLHYAGAENAIYMCDGLNNRVVKLNLDGQPLGVFGSYGKTPGKFDYAHNIAVDSHGAIYVVEIKNWRVQKFVK
jgi:DNA-binding beta-propeller fold protein YncE